MKNLKTYIFVILFTLSYVIGYSQIGKIEFLRNDSALLKKHQAEFDRLMSENDPNFASDQLDKIALLYWKKNYYQEAINYFEKSLPLKQKLNSQSAISAIHSNLGLLYADLGQYNKAILHFEKTYAYRLSLRNKGIATNKAENLKGLISMLINIATANAKIGNYKKAITVVEKAFDFAKEQNDIEDMKLCSGTLAELHQKAGNTEKAEEYFKQFKRYYDLLHKKVQNDVVEERNKAIFAENEKLKKENELLLKKYELDSTNKKLINTSKDLINTNNKLEESQDSLISAQNENLDLTGNLTKVELKNKVIEARRKQFLYIVLFIAFAVLTFIIILLLAYKQKKKANNALEMKNVEITQQQEEIKVQRDNLEDANKILEIKNAEIMQQREEIEVQRDNLEDANKILEMQNAEIQQQQEEIKVQRDNLEDANKILGAKNEKINNQKESLTLAFNTIEDKNKNIIDSINYAKLIQTAMLSKKNRANNYFKDYFIFFKPKDIVSGDFYWYSMKGDEVIIAAVDCTGHGVPGAFLSMMGNDILHRLVDYESITNPAEILKRMDTEVKILLNQESSDNEDGMDASIINFNTKTKKLLFAGAQNPLKIVTNGKLKTIAGSYFSIGGYSYTDIEKKFDFHEIKIGEDSIIYMFSDGYKDQISENGSPFTGKDFDNLLLDISKLPTKKQEIYLENFHKKRKGKNNQTDDILFIGIKF